MTIIAVLRESEQSFLIGADSQVTDLHKCYKRYITKLNEIASIPLVWGCSGAEDVAEIFSNDLQKYNWNIQDADSCVQEAAEKLLEYNEKAYEGYRRIGKVDDYCPTECLMIGCIGNDKTLMCYHIHPNGILQQKLFNKEAFCSIGTGARTLDIILRTLECFGIK